MRPFLLASLGLNLVLATGWFFATRPEGPRRTGPLLRRVVTNVYQPIRTNVFFEHKPFSWRYVESTDYPTYIRNLEAIGCPKNTIRDIIVADVNQLFARRWATEIVSPAQHWWLSEPDAALAQTALEQRDALDHERRDLLTRLLGPGWDVSPDAIQVPGTGISLDGPLLGELSPEVKQAVRDIELRSRDRRNAALRAGREDGGALGPTELARIRQQTREELAKVLTPAQLEEYLLRYSRNAEQWREALRGFGASQDEFRGLFRATDTLELELELLAGATDPASAKQRAQLLADRETAIQRALAPDRYVYYKLNQDPVFVHARDTARQLGAPPEVVLPLYQVNQLTEQERRRLVQDRTLSPEELTQSLATIDQQRLDTLRKLLGDDAFRRLQQMSVR
ncbi:MAG: hypothetical protein FJ387_05635 [Verrucomicrobia bacterium]|nr:hypothetical protein [Verrucomicrobiota bacterium]